MSLFFNVSNNASLDAMLEKDVYKTRELTKFFDKDKWMKKFVKGYSGGVTPAMIAYSDIAKFIVISKNGVEMGYARISNYAHIFSEVCIDDVWSISEIFVLEKFRNTGVMSNLIKVLVNEYNVKSIYLTKERFYKHEHHLNRLGFGDCLILGDASFYMVYLKSFSKVLDDLCKIKKYIRYSKDMHSMH